MLQGIKENTLRELAGAGSIRNACLIGQYGGFVITVRYGELERQLASTRGDVRLFSLKNATDFLRGIGVVRFEVDSTNYEPGRLRKPRPDRAEAMRKTRTKPRQEALFNHVSDTAS